MFTYVFNWLYFTHCLTFFPLLITFFIFVHGFYSLSSTIDEVLSINPSANVFAIGDFSVHHKDWLTYSSGTDRPGKLCSNFSISDDLAQTVNFPTWIPDCHSHSPVLLDFLLLMLLFVLQGFPYTGKFWSCCCLSFHWFSIKFTMGCLVLWHSLWIFLCWLGWSSWLPERCSIGGYL